MPTTSNRQAARERVTLAEHQSLTVAAALLTGDDLVRLDRLAARNILHCRPARDGYRLESRSRVGLLVLDRLIVEIKPKLGIAGEQLITWLGYAAGIDPHHLDIDRTWHTAPSSLIDLVVTALVTECRNLLRNGLMRSYVREDRIEPVLRGRLDLRAQVTRRYGMIDRLHVQTFDRHPDIWENQTCHAALTLGARLAYDPAVKRAASEIAAAFPAHLGGRRHAEGKLKRAHYHRMNASYRNAHRWAQLLFSGNGPADLLRESHAVAGSFLLHMDALWERVVHRMAEDAARAMDAIVVPATGRLALTVTADGRPASSLRPDVLVRTSTRPARVIPIDAKYLTPKAQVVESDDLHQLLTYACAYPMPNPPRAMIVQPSTTGWTHHWVAVTGPRGLLAKILVVGIDINQHPAACANRFKTEIQRLISASAPAVQI